jgi:hypothetical protein
VLVVIVLRRRFHSSFQFIWPVCFIHQVKRGFRHTRSAYLSGYTSTVMLLSDIEMEDASPYLGLSALNSSQDDDISSPRTPTYAPTSLSFANVLPFDPFILFRPTSPTKSTVKKDQWTLPSTPTKPLAWIWQCHLCRSRWPLGATRRCLVDGHYYCSGENDQRNVKKQKKYQSCSSEFDYVGWREWSDWKRKALKSIENPHLPKGCETCEFPSQCRYSKALGVGMHDVKTVSTKPGRKRDLKPILSVETDKEDLPRYYCTENATGESLLAEPLSGSKSPKQWKVTDFDKPEKTGSEKKSTTVPPANTSGKTRGKQSTKKGTLPPIEEEIFRAEMSM